MILITAGAFGALSSTQPLTQTLTAYNAEPTGMLQCLYRWDMSAVLEVEIALLHILQVSDIVVEEQLSGVCLSSACIALASDRGRLSVF